MTAAVTPAVHALPGSHVVVSGDTLWGIASDVYGDGYDWPALCQANRDLITDCNLIYPGQHLTIPVHTARGPVLSRVPHPVITAPKYELSGTLNCGGLEQLWVANGGNPLYQYTAAAVAMAESSGQQYAVSPTDDIGYWQINYPTWGPELATTDPNGNARAAIEISHDGTDWWPWTTYKGGNYLGRC